jgi:hypothetical protein
MGDFSLEDWYLRVGACGRVEYLEVLARAHALGKLRVSGLPNGRGERRVIEPLTLIDYRLAFSTGDKGAMAVRKSLAARWLPCQTIPPPRKCGWPLSSRAASSGPDWRFTAPSIAAPRHGRVLLAEDGAEIDERAYRAIMHACTRSKPGDAPAAFTGLQLRLSEKEFIKLFPKRAPVRALTGAGVREILQKAIAEKPSPLSQLEAVTLIKSIDRLFDREKVREIARELTGNRAPGRPKLIGGK